MLLSSHTPITKLTQIGPVYCGHMRSVTPYFDAVLSKVNFVFFEGPHIS